MHTNEKLTTGDAAIPYGQKPQILRPLIVRMRSVANQITDAAQTGLHATAQTFADATFLSPFHK